MYPPAQPPDQDVSAKSIWPKNSAKLAADSENRDDDTWTCAVQAKQRETGLCLSPHASVFTDSLAL